MQAGAHQISEVTHAPSIPSGNGNIQAQTEQILIEDDHAVTRASCFRSDAASLRAS